MKKKQSEETEKLSKEVSELIKEEDIKKRWDAINRNQQLIYDKITSTEGTAKKHVKLVSELLSDYVELFQRKIRIVDSLYELQKQLTSELKTKNRASDTLMKLLLEATKESDKARKFFNIETERLSNLNVLYNERIFELNEKLLKR